MKKEAQIKYKAKNDLHNEKQYEFFLITYKALKALVILMTPLYSQKGVTCFKCLHAFSNETKPYSKIIIICSIINYIMNLEGSHENHLISYNFF
jgi:hypothetical protein